MLSHTTRPAFACAWRAAALARPASLLLAPALPPRMRGAGLRVHTSTAEEGSSGPSSASGSDGGTGGSGKRGKWSWKKRVVVGALGLWAAVWVADYVYNEEVDVVVENLLRSRLTEEERQRRPKLVILGTGWAALSLIRSLQTDKFNVFLISPRNYFLFTPLLPSTTTGLLEPRSIIEPIRKFCLRSDASDVRFVEAECVSIDPVTKKVVCEDNSAVKGLLSKFELEYDHLVVACGAEAATFGVPGVKEYGCFMKEIPDAVNIRNRIMDCLETACIPGQPSSEIDRLLHFVVVGGGPSGVEFSGELSDFLERDAKRAFPQFKDRIKITLVEALPKILGMFDQQLIDYAEENLAKAKAITVKTRLAVTDVREHELTMKSMETGEKTDVPYGMLVWVTGNTPRPVITDLIKKIGPVQNSRRGLVVDDYFRVKGVENIWALGDCTFTQYPATAQVASQEGRYLGKLFNKLNAVIDEDVHSTTNQARLPEALATQEPFQYHHLGSFAYVGNHSAIAQFNSQDAKKKDALMFTGYSTFILWRSVYLSKLLSYKNRCLVTFDWVKNTVFGSDISRC